MSGGDDKTALRSPANGAQTLLILGARGDLTARLLLPGLGGLVATASLGNLFLVGSNRGEWSNEQWRSLVAGAFAAANASGPAIDAVVANAEYITADATDENDLRRLLAARRGRLTVYFALPPAVTGARSDWRAGRHAPSAREAVRDRRRERHCA